MHIKKPSNRGLFYDEFLLRLLAILRMTLPIDISHSLTLSILDDQCVQIVNE
jgi:hypothetical protein